MQKATHVSADSDVKSEAGFESLESAFADRPQSLLAAQDLDYYFDSYSQVGIHYDMLCDRARTLCYKNSMTQNPQLFAGKAVMDIGCGTGILSMFAASAGARVVVAIEMASILNAARRIVAENGLRESVHFCAGKIEELTLPLQQVDVIVSEWMGYLLLFEGMFDSVLFARDKYLAPGGKLFPNRALMFVAGFENFRFGDAVRDYHCFKGVNYADFEEVAYLMPDVDLVDSRALLTDEVTVADFDLERVTLAELDFRREIVLRASKHGYVHGLAVWFDCLFTHGAHPLTLSTSPHSTPTHWKQALLYLRVPLPMRVGDELRATLTLKKHKLNPRSLDLRLDYEFYSDVAHVCETQYFLFK